MRVVASKSGRVLNGRLFAVPYVDTELRPSCRIDNNKSSPLRDIAHYVPTPRFDLSCPSGTSLPVSATTPIILVTTEVSPIIIAHLPHTISGLEIRNRRKWALPRKNASRFWVYPFYMHFFLGNTHGCVACPHLLRDFQTQLVCDLDKILLLEVTLAPKGQDNFISARLGST